MSFVLSTFIYSCMYKIYSVFDGFCCVDYMADLCLPKSPNLFLGWLTVTTWCVCNKFIGKCHQSIEFEWFSDDWHESEPVEKPFSKRDIYTETLVWIIMLWASSNKSHWTGDSSVDVLTSRKSATTAVKTNRVSQREVHAYWNMEHSQFLHLHFLISVSSLMSSWQALQ